MEWKFPKGQENENNLDKQSRKTMKGQCCWIMKHSLKMMRRLGRREFLNLGDWKVCFTQSRLQWLWIQREVSAFLVLCIIDMVALHLGFSKTVIMGDNFILLNVTFSIKTQLNPLLRVGKALCVCIFVYTSKQISGQIIWSYSFSLENMIIITT